jgi:hypothetical protein
VCITRVHVLGAYYGRYRFFYVFNATYYHRHVLATEIHCIHLSPVYVIHVTTVSIKSKDFTAYISMYSVNVILKIDVCSNIYNKHLAMYWHGVQEYRYKLIPCACVVLILI